MKSKIPAKKAVKTIAKKAALKSAVAAVEKIAARAETPLARRAEKPVAKRDAPVAAEASLPAPAPAPESEWIELYPQGISITSENGRPVLVLKDQLGIDVLPVWMTPLDAGIALSELTSTNGLTPHLVSRRILEQLGVRAIGCSFVELIGHHQFVVIEFEGSEKLKALRVRADEAMSFCVQARVKFRATRAYMLRCRDVDAEMEKLEQDTPSAQLASAALNSENSSKKHPYVI